MHPTHFSTPDSRRVGCNSFTTRVSAKYGGSINDPRIFVGAQSSTVVIRGLNVEQTRMKQALWVVRREAIAGLFLGAMLGLVVFVWATILQGDPAVAIAVGLSLFAISLLASIAGSALPFLFRSFGLDPALMSAPFITTAVDVLGVLIYLNVARAILQL